MVRKTKIVSLLMRDPTTDSLYEVFCDFTSADGFVWTVVDSFSFSNKNEFADKAFYKDYPANQEAFTWNRFRLSWSRMAAIAKHSKHVEPHATLTLMDSNSVIT